MSARSAIPFNISLLELTPKKLEGLKPVTKLDIMDGATNNFAEEGLFSVSIFGKVGDERRNARFSYIDIKVPIFHPIIFRTLVTLKRLYGDILAGTDYAVWNNQLKDFERASALTGKTGYHFFVQHWRQINFDNTKSDARDQKILLLHKYAEKALTSKIVVLPAGLRDIEITNDGRMKEDEINTFYRALLAISNSITANAVESNPELVNTSRYTLQTKFNALYDLLESMVEGKKKLLMGKWASRRIMNGTRNVITAMDTSVPYLGAPGAVGFNHTLIGLYQAMKSILPVAIYHLRRGFLAQVFREVNAPVKLVNKKTLMAEEVALKSQYFDRWMTNEGIEKVITAFQEEGLRNKPLEIEGRYLGLIYKGPDHTFKLIHDIREVPEARNNGDVMPLTFCELLYCSLYRVINRHPLFVTRYPITGVGSIYPSKMYVKTTIKSEVRRELNAAWEPQDETYVAYEFPTRGDYVNSLVPHPSKLDGMEADFDGDTSSGNATYGDESIAEIDNYLTKKRAYVGTDGKFISSVDISTIALVLHNLTGD